MDRIREDTADTLLTHVGPGTPCGDYLRRYWHPFMLSSELKDTPVLLNLLGEELVAFRDRSGRAGLLHKHCAHRGTSLEFGIPAERGLRCCYHGWLFDVDGTVLETPAEPPTSRLREHVRQGAYPVRELHGLIFAYLGPNEHMPALPILDTLRTPADNNPVPYRFEMPCNWLQVVENACDPIHNAFLHAVASNQFAASFKVLPALDFVETPLGFLSMATRKVKDHVFVRASDIILPNIGQFTGASNDASRESFRIGCGRVRWVTPIDDVNCHYIGYINFNAAHRPYGELKESDLGVGRAGFIGQTADRPYEERQREPGDYDAVVSQGRIANRAAEHLGVADRGVVMFRRMLARAIEATAAGQAPEQPRPVVAGELTRTYAHEYALLIPPGVDLSSYEALQSFGRCAAERVILAQARGEPESLASDAVKMILGAPR